MGWLKSSASARGAVQGACVAILVVLLAVGVPPAVPFGPTAARAAVSAQSQASASSASEGGDLEAAASRAGSTGRKIAMSLIGLGFAIAGVMLAFRRDFKEAAGVFAVGVVAVLFATPAGLHLLQDTVSSIFGAQ